MKKLLSVIISMLIAACAGEAPAPQCIIKDIPMSAPQLPADVALDRARYTHKVDVLFDGLKVHLSQLPQGITATVKGANVVLRSSLAGVEYIVKGHTDKGSLLLVSEKSPLVTFDSLNIHSGGCNAVTISSKEKIFIGGSEAFFTDELCCSGKIDKQAAALSLLGDAVMCDGLNLCVQATRRDAVSVSGILYNCGANIVVEYAAASAFNVTQGFVMVGGNISATALKDIVKVKKGNYVMLGGNVQLGAANEKADAITARNIYQYGGAISANLQGAAAKGLKSKESVYLIGGELKVHTSGGALFSEKKSDYSSSSCVKSTANVYIKATNVSLESDGDAGKGINCDGLLQIDGGIISIKTTGNDVNHPIDLNAHASPKGIKCDSTLLINGGKIEVLVLGRGERCEGVESKGDIIIDGADTKLYVYAYDDAINSGGNLTINDGTVYVYSVANDGIDSNAKIDINGGVVLANGVHSPELGIDTDVEQMFTLTGGTMISFGGSMGPAPCLPKSRETDAAVVAWSGVDVERNSYLNLADENGAVMLSYRLPRSMRAASFMVAAPSLSRGDRYSLFLSDSITGGKRLGYGLYADAQPTTKQNVVEWEQNALLSVINSKGAVEHINPDTLKNRGMRPPMGPPPTGAPGQFPMGPPPPGTMPPPALIIDKIIDNIYGVNNLPGVGW